MANISNINDFFVVDSVGLKAAVGADLGNSHGTPYVGTDFTVVGKDASNPVANLWLSNFTHKSYILVSDNSSNFIIKDSAAGNRLVINSSGYVGIGTDSPDAKFQVQGNVKVGSASGASWTDAKDDIGGLDVFVGSGSNAFQVWDDNDQTNPRFVVKRAGNVGIGTTTPDKLLEISHDAASHDPVLRLTGTNTGAFAAGIEWQSGFGPKTSAQIFSTASGSQGGELWINVRDQATNALVRRMYFKNDGNVGIGTSAPGARIDIKGVAGSPATSGTTQNGILRIQNATNNNTLDIGQVAGSPYGTWLQAADKSDLNPIYTYPILLNPLGGRVGIGNPSPTYQLDVLGSGGNGGIIHVKNTDAVQYPRLAIQSDVKGYHIGVGGSGAGAGYANNLYFYDNNVAAVRMVIDTSGNVGIGTTSPDTKLHIYGSSTVSEMYLGEDAAIDKAGILKYNQGDGTGTGSVQLGNYGDNLNTTGVTIKKGGNVGIGTSLPAYKTSVFKGGDYNGSEILLDLSIKDTVGGSYNANTGAGISFSSSHWSVSPTEKIMGAIYGANTDGGTAANGYLSLRTRTSDSVTEKMRITGGGQLLLPTTGLNDTRHIILTGTQGTANNACAIGMWGNEARFSSNWYYNGAQRKTVAGNGMAVVGLSTGTTDATTFITFAAAVPTATGGPTEKMRITSPGYVYLGQGFNATNHRINRASTQGSVVLVVSGYGGSGIAADTAIFQATAAGGANAANAGMKIEKNSSTNRSINAAGTVNASGNDYAEYMEKKSTAFEIAAGDICGVNENGKLTNKFTEAHSFVVKSTDPSYVGGDTWGNSVGKKPYLTTQGPIETDAEYAERTAQYETDLANFKVALEAQRIKYDRIAFSGQVPVNITGASVGDYIIPILKEGNLITGETVTSPSFEQYQIAIGKVWKILEDGRAFISVKIV